MKSIYETPQIDIVVFDMKDRINTVVTTSANLNNFNRKFKYTEVEEIE